MTATTSKMPYVQGHVQNYSVNRIWRSPFINQILIYVGSYRFIDIALVTFNEGRFILLHFKYNNNLQNYTGFFWVALLILAKY